jgi:hypothetical protein
MQPLTDEERQKFCAELRELGELYAEESVRCSFPGVGELLIVAADEIERLIKELEGWQEWARL